MSDYKPGTLAVATVRGLPNVRVMRLEGSGWVSGEPVAGTKIHRDEPTDVRPLVVLDLSAGTAEEYLGAIRDLAVWTTTAPAQRSLDLVRHLGNQIEAQTRPPKPPEPTVRGAVVADASGLEWVRVHPAGPAWVNGYERWAAWDDIDAVKVVRP